MQLAIRWHFMRNWPFWLFIVLFLIVGSVLWVSRTGKGRPVTGDPFLDHLRESASSVSFRSEFITETINIEEMRFRAPAMKIRAEVVDEFRRRGWDVDGDTERVNCTNQGPGPIERVSWDINWDPKFDGSYTCQVYVDYRLTPAQLAADVVRRKIENKQYRIGPGPPTLK